MKQIPKMASLFLPVVFAFMHLCAQQGAHDLRIGEFENGLTPDVPVVFADSPLKRYNIVDRMNETGVPSVSVAVIRDGKLLWARAWGLADDALNRAADNQTLYQAASMSKSVNAFCIMRLVQEGRLSLDKDIRDYLKTWTFPDNDFSRGKAITLRNLLSHTAGLSTGGFKGYTLSEPLPGINQILDGQAPANSDGVRPLMAPGTAYQYSGGGILVTKKILQDNIDRDYAHLLYEKVLNPLGMASSSFEQPLSVGFKKQATAYDRNRKEIEGKFYIYPEQSPDGLWTTPSDFAKFIISLQLSLAGKKGLLTQSLAQEMVKPVLPGINPALGVFVRDGKEKYFYHEGANVGFRSVFYGSFDTGDGVVVMINSDNGQLLQEIANSVALTYGWKDFYTPKYVKLAGVPEKLLDGYVGEYRSEQPPVTIRIRNKGGRLELTARGDDNFETMYFTAPDTFFLLSSPSSKGIFLPGSDGGNSYQLKVVDGDKLLISAKKQSL